MPEPYEFFDHTADIGAHVFGRTLEELFINAACAMYEALGKLQKTEDRKQKVIELRAEVLEDLLHDWLAELLYEVEVNHILYDEMATLTIRGSAVPREERCPTGLRPGAIPKAGRGREAAPTFELNATLSGSAIDFARSQTNEEIKAVTYHQLRVEQTTDGSWRATVIFDV